MAASKPTKTSPIKKTTATFSVKPVRTGSLLSVRATEPKYASWPLYAGIPLGIAVLLLLLAITVPLPRGWVLLSFALMGLTVAMFALFVHFARRTSLLMFTEEDVRIEMPGEKYDAPWTDLVALEEKEFFVAGMFSRARFGLELLLTVRHGEKEELLRIGRISVSTTGAIVLGVPVSSDTLFLSGTVSPGYDETIAYLAAKGVKVVRAPASKTVDLIAKARKEKRIK